MVLETKHHWENDRNFKMKENGLQERICGTFSFWETIIFVKLNCTVTDAVIYSLESNSDS